ncbi:MAG: toll/interleukin-1 receptor domain-containing protein [Acidobacteriota bacterium]|nr:toll/interleukin-1 receptor domain-containing protein [Acidobacteriota bacterium]
MKVFISHSSRDKALVREVLSYLPSHVSPWLDEREIRVGEDFHEVLERAINDETDFVVVFLDRNSIASEWVQRELTWSMERERQLGRVFILPVLLEDVWSQVEPREFQKRKYLRCFDQSKRDVENLATELKDELFAWLSINMAEERQKRVAQWKERKKDLLRMALRHPNPAWRFRTPKVIADESKLTEDQARILLDEMGAEVIWDTNPEWGDIVALRIEPGEQRAEAKHIILRRLGDQKWDRISFDRLRHQTGRHDWDDNFLRSVVDNYGDVFGHTQFHPNYLPGLYVKRWDI